jgi:hypothetical protein
MTEESKSALFPQEVYMRSQLDRQSHPLQQQKESFSYYNSQEKPLINKLLLADCFEVPSNSFPSWETASFYPGSSDTPTEVRSEFFPVNTDNTPFGLQLRSVIIRTTHTVRLASIACELKLSFRLTGDSTLWIITRGTSVRDPDAVVCKIKKELDNQRVFLIFGANIGRTNEFKFFKKQEFPEMYRGGEELLQDYVDMKIRFVDNGDEKVLVEATLGKDKRIEMGCDKFIPCFRETQVFVAGSGDSVLLRNASLRQIARTENRPVQNRYECCRLF